MLKIDTSQTRAQFTVKNSSCLSYIGWVLELDADERRPQPAVQLVHNHWAKDL